MTPTDQTNDMASLVQKNIVLTEQVILQQKKIQRRLTAMVWGNYIRLLFILVPIILGVIYLPSLLKQFWNQYNQLTGLINPSENTSVFSEMFSKAGNAQLEEFVRQLEKQKQ